MSTTPDRPRNSGGHRAPRGPGLGRALVLLVVLLSTVLGAQPASAFWSAAGAGGGVARTGSLAAPAGVTVPATAVTDVPVSWTAGTGDTAAAGYYVTRTSGATTAPACGSSPTVLLTATSCSDPGVPDGDHTYVVTAVFRTWTARGTSAVVTVVNPAKLAFLTPPSDTTAGEPVIPSVVVGLRSAAGDAVARSGVAVTLAIGTNPGGGSLAGVRTVSTAADGTATFPGLTLDQPGVGYTLVATSPGLTSATSAGFTVLPPPVLAEAGRYSVLGGGGVTNTLATTLSGDLGVAPGFTVSGFPPGTVGGDLHDGDADAVAALADAAEAYAALRLLPVTSEISGDLAGVTLTPGVHHSTGALGVTGTATLAGGPDDVFVIRVDAALNTAAQARVLLTGGAQAANVFWVVEGAVTLGAGTEFVGTILADGAITIGLGTQVIGRALATGVVTLANATVRFTPALPPTISIAGGPSVGTKDTTPTLSGTSNAPAGTTVRVTVAGQTLTTAVQAGGGWTVTAAALPAGSYDVVAQVRDAAGNATRATQTLVVEVNPDPVPLRSTASFSVLGGGAGPAVGSTGPTSLSGDAGASPGAVTGFPPGTLAGTIHSGDTTAATAQDDLLAAIGDASGRTAHTQFAGDLAARTFHIGVHHSLAAVGLTGTVALDGEGDPNAVFIFQISGALTGAAGCRVDLVNGAQASNVFWVVDGAVTLGAGCAFAGSTLARGAVTLGASTSVEGRVLSRGAVTLAGNAITGATPAPAPAPAPAAARGRASAPSPEPAASADATTPAATPSPTPTPAPTPSPTPSDPTAPTAVPSPSPSSTPEATP